MATRFLTLSVLSVMSISLISCDPDYTASSDRISDTIDSNIGIQNTSTETGQAHKVIWNKNVFSADLYKKERERVFYEFDIDDDTKSITAKVTAEHPDANIRISQVIFPDGSADGPFSHKAKIDIIQKGEYRIIISESSMNGEPFEGAFNFEIVKQ